MTERSEQGPQAISLDARKTLKDRLNYPFLMEQAIINFQKSVNNLDRSDTEMLEAIQAVVHMIPSAWWDKIFKQDYEKAKIRKMVDSRPSFCGTVATAEWCSDHGVQAFAEEISFDYHKLFQATVDLLDRLGLLSRKWFTERMTGRRYTGPAADISDSEQDAQEMDI